MSEREDVSGPAYVLIISGKSLVVSFIYLTVMEIIVWLFFDYSANGANKFYLKISYTSSKAQAGWRFRPP